MPQPRTADQRDVDRGRELAARRKLAGMTQGELAAELNISAQQLSKYERGINRMSMNVHETAMDLTGPSGTPESGFSEQAQAAYSIDPSVALSQLRSTLRQLRDDVDRCMTILDQLDGRPGDKRRGRRSLSR